MNALFKKREVPNEPEYRLIIESSPPGYTSDYMWSLYTPGGRCVVKQNFAVTQTGCRRAAGRAKRKDMDEQLRIVETV